MDLEPGECLLERRTIARSVLKIGHFDNVGGVTHAETIGLYSNLSPYRRGSGCDAPLFAAKIVGRQHDSNAGDRLVHIGSKVL